MRPLPQTCAIIYQNRDTRKADNRLQLPVDAYLDIETTGLCSFYDEITVIGICLANSTEKRLVQLVGIDATGDNLLRTLRCVDTIYTYNGSRFDLPFINFRLGINLKEHFHHRDLMHDCWRNNLYGGFKAVERQLNIPRRLRGITGAEAVVLWWRYQIGRDKKALDLLLEYNKEDVVNLITLRRKLEKLVKSRYRY
ncbi:MAG: ribonuclease H-like domain-containing protein [Dehalococcoidia bacterium]|nr:ribonuclease H-like domain-containing protein [Dehalococcoidia bacterium]RLC60821.1 MAG: exonuclease [Chloroflexota bacterium]